MLNDSARQVEIELPGRYEVNHQIADALRAAQGAGSVELRCNRLPRPCAGQPAMHSDGKTSGSATMAGRDVHAGGLP